MVRETNIPGKLLANLSITLKQQWQELTQSNATPRNLAAAFALGAFISVLPIPGVDLMVTTLLAAWFKQLNRAALYAAAVVWNTFVVAPFYILSRQVGGFLFQTGYIPELTLGGQASALAQRFLVGNLVVAVLVTAVSFLTVQSGLTLYRASAVDNGRS